MRTPRSILLLGVAVVVAAPRGAAAQPVCPAEDAACGANAAVRSLAGRSYQARLDVRIAGGPSGAKAVPLTDIRIRSRITSPERRHDVIDVLTPGRQHLIAVRWDGAWFVGRADDRILRISAGQPYSFSAGRRWFDAVETSASAEGRATALGAPPGRPLLRTIRRTQSARGANPLRDLVIANLALSAGTRRSAIASRLRMSSSSTQITFDPTTGDLVRLVARGDMSLALDARTRVRIVVTASASYGGLHGDVVVDPPVERGVLRTDQQILTFLRQISARDFRARAREICESSAQALRGARPVGAPPDAQPWEVAAVRAIVRSDRAGQLASMLPPVRLRRDLALVVRRERARAEATLEAAAAARGHEPARQEAILRHARSRVAPTREIYARMGLRACT